MRTKNLYYDYYYYYCEELLCWNECVCVLVPRRRRGSVHSSLESVESQYNPLSWSKCTAAGWRGGIEKNEEEETTLDTPGKLINSRDALLTWCSARLCVRYLAVRAASVVHGQRRLCDGPAHWGAAVAVQILLSAGVMGMRRRTDQTRWPRAWMMTTNTATGISECVWNQNRQTCGLGGGTYEGSSPSGWQGPVWVCGPLNSSVAADARRDNGTC